MKFAERILAGSAVGVCPPHKLSTPFARQRGSIGGATDHLNCLRQVNCLRQSTALAVSKGRGLQGFQPLSCFKSSVEPPSSVIEWPSGLQSTRHSVPSNFPSNSLKTKKSGPSYSTQKRGVSIDAYLPQLGNFESNPYSTNRRGAGKLLSIPKEMNSTCCALD
jgi:hypothetical protein